MATLAELIAALPDVEKVYAANWKEGARGRKRSDGTERTPGEHALDGVVWHVFNTLRGGDPSQLDTAGLSDTTYDDVKAIILTVFNAKGLAVE